MTSAGPAGQERLPLSRERILQAALELLDENGIEGLTMRRLGAHLGVEAMSIYNHVPNKAALVDGVVELVVAEIEIPPRDGDWAERAKRILRSYRSVTQVHPHAVSLLAMRPFANIPALRQVEAGFEVLSDAGLTGTRIADAFRSISAWVLGFTLSEAAASLGTAPYGGTEVATDPTEMSLAEFPRLAELAPYFLTADPDAQFEFGLDLWIAGLRTEAGQS